MFCSNRCSLSEHKRLFKIFKILPTPNVWTVVVYIILYYIIVLFYIYFSHFWDCKTMCTVCKEESLLCCRGWRPRCVCVRLSMCALRTVNTHCCLRRLSSCWRSFCSPVATVSFLWPSVTELTPCCPSTATSTSAHR